MIQRYLRKHHFCRSNDIQKWLLIEDVQVRLRDWGDLASVEPEVPRSRDMSCQDRVQRDGKFQAWRPSNEVIDISFQKTNYNI
jgi:hypothetical protein